MRFTNMFNESVSTIVYHYTTHVNAFNILKNGEFRMSPTFIHPSNIEGNKSNKFFYLSTTRSKLGHYHQSEISGVIFKLDGDKINQRHKGSQVNYYSDLKINDEMEDRILSDKPTLSTKNIIMSIDVLISPKHSNDTINTITYFVYVYGKKNGIPVNVYTDPKSMNTNNIKNALSFDAIKQLKAGTYTPTDDRRDTDIPKIVALYHKSYGQLNKDELKVRNEIIKNPDFHTSIRHDLDTLKNTNGGMHTLNNISKILKKEKLTTYKELLEVLKERFLGEDKIRQREQRQQYALNRYKKDKAMFDHILNVLNDEVEFNMDYMNVTSEDALYMKIPNMLDILEKLDMIPERIKLIWYDDYGMSEDGYRKFFNMTV